MINQHQELLFQLLRQSMGLTGQENFKATVEEWRGLYEEAARQSLTGVLYTAVEKLPKEQQPPLDIAMQWMSEAEAIRGMNTLQNQEAARLTRVFGDAGRRTAILKGQANARLYPDKLSRQPGDIDLWVEGGRESVKALVLRMGLIDEEPTISNAGMRDKATASYHHIHLPKNEQGIDVEIHYRPSSGNFNPFTNRRLQLWLEEKIKHTTAVPEEFNVPSVRFALVMQLSHVQRHFLGGGIGLRHVCDFYWLLKNATDEDRQAVSEQLDRFGLLQTAGALMWVLGKVLLLDPKLMVCKPDDYRGKWMLREIMAGGNFGRYAQRQGQGKWRRFFSGQLRRVRMLPFAPTEVAWNFVKYWQAVGKTMPERIRRRSWSLSEADKRDAKKKHT